MKKLIKLILSLFLLLCLADMPYGYYQFVRFVSAIAFVYFAYEERQRDTKLVFLYVFLALLFQPFSKIALGRDLWNMVDVLVAIFLLRSILIKIKQP